MDFIYLFFFCLVCYFCYKNTNVYLQYIVYEIINNKKFMYTFLIATLLLVSFTVRVLFFADIPAGLNQDEALAGVEAYFLSETGRDRDGMIFPVYFTAWYSSQMNVLESLLMIIPIKLFGFSVFSVRLPMLICSLLSILVLFDFARHIFGIKPAIYVLFFVTINPWHIVVSRWALESNIFPHFILFSLYFLYLGIKKRDIYIYVSMIFFGLTMYSYGIAYYTIPVLLIWLSIYLYFEKLIKPSVIINSIVIYLLISWPIFAMIIVNMFKLKTIYLPFLTIPYFDSNVRSEDILFFKKDNIYFQAQSNFIDALKVTLFQFPKERWNAIPKYGTYYLYSVPLFFLGYNEISKNRIFDKIGVKFFKMFFIISIFGGVLLNVSNVNQNNIFFYPIIVITSIGLFKVLSYRKTYVLIILFIYLSSFINFSKDYFYIFKNDLKREFYVGFDKSIEKAMSLNKKKFIITSNSYTQDSYMISEILTLFYTKLDPTYYLREKDASYRDKFIYANFRDEFTNLRDSNAVYVFNIDEIDLFDNNDYEINVYDIFGTAVFK